MAYRSIPPWVYLDFFPKILSTMDPAVVPPVFGFSLTDRIERFLADGRGIVYWMIRVMPNVFQQHPLFFSVFVVPAPTHAAIICPTPFVPWTTPEIAVCITPCLHALVVIEIFVVPYLLHLSKHSLDHRGFAKVLLG